MESTWSIGTPTVPALLRTRAIPITYSPGTPQTSARRYDMGDISSATSSPSLYSHAPSHAGHVSRNRRTIYHREFDDVDDDPEPSYEQPCTRSRISMVAGPTVRKYSDNPWDEADERGTMGSFGRIIRAATSRTVSSQSRSRPASPSAGMSGSSSINTEASASTRRGLSIFGTGSSRGAKHLGTSSSGISLASTQTISTASSAEESRPPSTPRLRAAFGSPPSPAHRRSSETLHHAHLNPAFEDGNETGYHRSPLKPKVVGGLEPSLLPFPPSSSPPANLKTPSNGRPLLSGGSPGFGLISLEAAQERERQKHLRRTTTAQATRPVLETRTPLKERTNQVVTPSKIPLKPSATAHALSPAPPLPEGHRIRTKKSGLMRMFKQDKAPPALPTPTPALPTSAKMPTPAPPDTARPPLLRGNSEKHSLRTETTYPETSDPGITWPASRAPEPSPRLGAELVKPRLELRPISMNFSNALPSDYLAAGPAQELDDPDEADTRNDADLAEAIREQIANARKGWLVQVFELEAQVRELKDELDEARRHKAGMCSACGCTCGTVTQVKQVKDTLKVVGHSVMDRGRAKTGGARGVFGSGSLYEWE